jgi:hypothetical protein
MQKRAAEGYVVTRRRGLSRGSRSVDSERSRHCRRACDRHRCGNRCSMATSIPMGNSHSTSRVVHSSRPHDARSDSAKADGWQANTIAAGRAAQSSIPIEGFPAAPALLAFVPDQGPCRGRKPGDLSRPSPDRRFWRVRRSMRSFGSFAVR